jgi:chromosome segregation ATPase
MNYEHKYRKYKMKYLRLKQTQMGGMIGGDLKALESLLHDLENLEKLLPDIASKAQTIDKELSNISQNLQQAGVPELQQFQKAIEHIRTVIRSGPVSGIAVQQISQQLHQLISVLKNLIPKLRDLANAKAQLAQQTRTLFVPLASMATQAMQHAQHPQELAQRAKALVQHPGKLMHAIETSEVPSQMIQLSEEVEHAGKNIAGFGEQIAKVSQAVKATLQKPPRQMSEMSQAVPEHVKALAGKLTGKLDQSPQSSSASVGGLLSEPLPY